ncbi:hypothetical protein CIB48_g11708 [Xylaria polymorpha]|nr:hypothetical protein CIB48_g11708 [Xylaria polymorpha]
MKETPSPKTPNNVVSQLILQFWLGRRPPGLRFAIGILTAAATTICRPENAKSEKSGPRVTRTNPRDWDTHHMLAATGLDQSDQLFRPDLIDPDLLRQLRSSSAAAALTADTTATCLRVAEAEYHLAQARLVFCQVALKAAGRWGDDLDFRLAD